MDRCSSLLSLLSFLSRRSLLPLLLRVEKIEHTPKNYLEAKSTTPDIAFGRVRRHPGRGG